MHCSKPVFQCIMFETKGNLLSKDPIIRSEDLDAAEVSWFAPSVTMISAIWVFLMMS